MKKNILLLLQLLVFTPSLFANEIKMGLAQSDLVWHTNNSTYPSAKMISDMASNGITAIRTNIRGSSSATDFANLVSLANRSGISVTAAILQEPEDYINPISTNAYGNTGSEFSNLCGYSGGSLKFSMLDLTLFKVRLQTHLNALKNIGANVEAFEIGNELDWACFNGDIPIGTGSKSNDPNLLGFLNKYDQVLLASSTLIKQNFPNTKVLTFGAASCSLFTQTSCLTDPTNFLTQLTNINSADAIALHVYPVDLPPFNSVTNLLNNYRSILGPNKKIWITESGFSQTSSNKTTLFQNLINTLKVSDLIDSFFAYTYFSYTGEFFSLSSGMNNSINSAINLFSPQSTATTCWINLEKCPAHPEWNLNGLFVDNNLNNSNTNKESCLSRAVDYRDACQSTSTVNASFTYTFNKLLIAENTAAVIAPITSCQITMADCPLHPDWNLTGTFIDSANYNNSNSNQLVCLSRAADYMNACRTLQDVKASFVKNGSVIEQKIVTPITSCQITMPNCPAHPEWNISGTFVDSSNYNNSNSNQLACLSRADDFLAACRPTGEVTASFTYNGSILQKKTVGAPATKCEITMSSCPRHPDWNLTGTFIDSANANNSNSNQQACLLRAKDYYNECIPTGTVKASFIDNGVSTAVKTYP